MDTIILQILVILNILSFTIGYFLGKLHNNQGVYINNKTQSFFDKEENRKKSAISIDSTKYVSEIKTDGMEKKYDTLGETKQSQENISLSVNKLKNLKG